MHAQNLGILKLRLQYPKAVKSLPKGGVGECERRNPCRKLCGGASTFRRWTAPLAKIHCRKLSHALCLSDWCKTGRGIRLVAWDDDSPHWGRFAPVARPVVVALPCQWTLHCNAEGAQEILTGHSQMAASPTPDYYHLAI
jgi:hypothetical protein